MQAEMEQESEGRILVVGLGNLLLGDEGAGVHTVRELEKRPLPSYVDAVDGGTAGLDLLDLIRGYEKVVIIDAVDADEEAGTIFRFTPQEVASASEGLPLSLHQTEVLQVLQLATYIGRALPPVVIYGIQPQSTSWSTELSPAVQARVSDLVASLLEEIA